MTEKTQVAPRNPDQKNSPFTGPTEGESTVILDTAATSCTWNGRDFEEGALVDCKGATYECSLGHWVKVS